MKICYSRKMKCNYRVEQNRRGHKSIDLLIYYLAFPPSGINLWWRERVQTAGGTTGH